MPDEVLHLLIIAVLKAYAAKFNVKKISVDGTAGAFELPSVNVLSDERLKAALDKYAGKVSLRWLKRRLWCFSSRNGGKNYAGYDKIFKICVKF